jgi:cobalt/nickel transport system permease protein
LSGNKFIERSIVGALSFFKESVFADEYAARNAFLQKINGHIKTISFLLLLLAVLFTRDLYHIAAIYLLVLALTSFSEINLWFFLKRTWIFIPLFSLFIAIPALFNFFSPGEPIFILNIFNLKFVITKQGLLAAGLFVLRVITSVSITVLLALTTRHNELLRVLRIFHVPQVFVMTLGMCYRYIYLFAEVVENTYLSIKSRVGGRIRHKDGREAIAWNIASLWHRSYHLNNQVFNAMLSRGYRGEPRVYDDVKTNLTDWVTLACATMIFILILINPSGM